MECLRWITEDRIPTPTELATLDSVITVSIAIMSKMTRCPVSLAFVLLLRLEFLMYAFDEGVERVKQAMLEAINNDPLLRLLAIVMAA